MYAIPQICKFKFNLKCFFFLLTLNFLIFFYLYQLKLNLHVYEVIYHILILLSLVRKRENGY